MRTNRVAERLPGHVFAVAGFLVLTGGTIPSPLSAAMTAEQLYRVLAPSVVVVEATDEGPEAAGSHGSGVVIAPAQVVTNCHVLGEHARLQVRVRGEETPYAAERLWADPERDLCVVGVPGLRAPAVPLGQSSDATVGQRVYAIGAPQGLAQTLSEGVISAVRTTEELIEVGLRPPRSLSEQLKAWQSRRRGQPTARYLQTTAAISPGSSGGGLFDAEGRLLGITTFLVKDGQNLNFAIPAEWLYDLPAALHASRLCEAGPATGSGPGASAKLEALRAMGEYWLRVGMPLEVSDFQELHDLAIQRLIELARGTRDLDDVELNHVADVVNHLHLAYGGLGQSAHARGVAKMLIPLAETEIRLSPDKPDGWRHLSNAYVDLGLLDQAVSAQKEAIRRCRPCPAKLLASFWSELGGIYMVMGVLTKAWEVYQTLTTLDTEKAEQFRRRFGLRP